MQGDLLYFEFDLGFKSLMSDTNYFLELVYWELIKLVRPDLHFLTNYQVNHLIPEDPVRDFEIHVHQSQNKVLVFY